MMIIEVMNRWDFVLMWGLLATVVMTTILYASQGLGLSRLSLSFLAGTFITGNRERANVLGFIVYMLGGWLFAFIYLHLLMSIKLPGALLGTLIGFFHGLFLLAVVLPLLPYAHPRMASEYDGPTHLRRLQPPGFIGLNYGYRTPLTTLLAQTVYGAILGICYQMSW